MSNAFTQFLSDFAGGIFDDTGYLKDYKHAARLYQDNYYGMSPKAGWSYFVEITLNPDFTNTAAYKNVIDQTWYNRSKNKIGLIAKTVDLPKFTIATETLNQYNKKTIVQTKITYNPINIVFHDDMDNMITDFWKNYYQYYYADSRYNGFSELTKNVGSNDTGGPAYAPQSKRDKRAYAYGLNNGQKTPFIKHIKVFLLNRQKYSSVTLINPMITEWAHGQLDQSQNRLLDNKMTVAFEAVAYDTGNKRINKTDPGFNSIHYDNSKSPLQVAGGKGGVAGMLGGAADILDVFGKEGPLSIGDIIGVAVGTNNLIKNAKKMTIQSIGSELTGSLIGSFSGAIAGKTGQGAGDRVVSDVLNKPAWPFKAVSLYDGPRDDTGNLVIKTVNKNIG